MFGRNRIDLEDFGGCQVCGGVDIMPSTKNFVPVESGVHYFVASSLHSWCTCVAKPVFASNTDTNRICSYDP
jgi:hypothetical protein